MAQFKITEVREPHESFGDEVLGLVTFEYTPRPTDGALVFSRFSKSKDRTYPVAKVVGATVVQVIGAQLRKSNKKGGAPWLATNNVEELPIDLLHAVAAEAMTWKDGAPPITAGAKGGAS